MVLRGAAVGGVGGLGLVLAGGAGWWAFSRSLPSVDGLAEYAPPEATILYDRHGVVLGELYDERRYVVPIEAIPEHVQLAFIAAEDAAFHTHGGVDYTGIVRAALRNVDEGKAAQGASTITQQVVRNLVLQDRTKSIERKVKEIALAWQVESRFDKDTILHLYLNSIYLGAQSYGVEAAARTYFGKSALELTLAEGSLLAGLPQRPSDYNPYKNLPRAKKRQAYVLEQMVAKGFATPHEAAAALVEPLTLRTPDNAFLDNAPDFTEHVRRLLVERFGEERVNRGGLRVTTTCDLEAQQAAKAAVRERVDALDSTSGFRRAGRETLPVAEIPAWRAARADARPLEAERVYEAVALSVGTDRARLGIGDHEVMVAIEDHRWISPRQFANSFTELLVTEDARREYWSWRKGRDEQELLDAADRLARGLPEPAVDTSAQRVAPGAPILQEGDIVQIRLIPGKRAASRDGRELPRALLVQDRQLEGAVMSVELETGAVRVLVGGADFRTSQFNRATQGRRQVGSTFKPFVYAAAIEQRTHTAASVVSDQGLSLPIGDGAYWTPRGAGEETDEPMTLTLGLARSRNLVLLRTLIATDAWMEGDVVYDLSRRLGLGGPPTHTLPADHVPSPEDEYLCPWTPEFTAAKHCPEHQPPLDGTMEMAAHRATVVPETPHTCRSCDYSLGLGSASLTLAEMVRAYSVFGTGGELVEPQFIEEVRDRKGDVLFARVPERAQVLDPGVAYVVNHMLQAVVTRGTGHAARALGVTVAGKTGTTDDGRDAWFIGMTPEVVTGVWVGFDTPQPIGRDATGGRVALPIWVATMRGLVDEDVRWPAPPAGQVVFANIDEATGGRVTEGGVRYPFLPGTVPGVLAPLPDATADAR